MQLTIANRYCDKTFSTLCIVSASVAALGYVVWLKQKQNKGRDTELPERWTAIGKVSKLIIYPLKSGYHKELTEANCKAKGMEETEPWFGNNYLRDRNFVLFDTASDKFITNKCYERIVLVETVEVDASTVEFRVRSGVTPPLILNIEEIQEHGAVSTFRMHFNERVKAFDCGDEASDWFSLFLLNRTNRSIRLGLSCDFQRTIKNSWDKYSTVYKHLSDEDTGRFSDLASYMIVNEESVNDLNKRIASNTNQPTDHFSCHYFRPNIVIRKCIPYEEDTWDWMKIGNVVFRVVKPCTRCIAITINPETGVKNTHLEPLRTLRSYRRLMSIDSNAKHLEGQSPVMGVYAGLYKEGSIKLNDIVFVAASHGGI